MKQLLILCISLILFTACGSESKKSINNKKAEYQAFSDHKKLWHNTQTKDYSFVVKKSCFCPYEENKQITVDNTKVIEAKYIPSNEVINDNKIKSMDDYFNIIEDALNKDVYTLTVNYDEIYGYPKEITIDYDEQMADEELTYTITHFTPTIDGRIICTKEYVPVCASVNIQCITRPCETVEETFSNKCMITANPNATYIRDGEC